MLLCVVYLCFFFEIYGDHRGLHLLTHSFPTPRSSAQGPRVRDLHLLFDDQAAQIWATIDPIAERVRKNGAPTLRSIGEISRRQSIKDADRKSTRLNSSH